MRYGFLFILLSLLAGCTPTAPAEPFRTLITAQGLENKVVMVLEENTAVFNIRSETGIGSANVLLQSGRWPSQVILRFYLSGLEELTVTYGDAILTLNISSTEANQIIQAVTRSGSTEPIDSDSPYWMDVSVLDAAGNPATIPVTDGAIEVSLPPDFFSQDVDSFALNWVDFYR